MFRNLNKFMFILILFLLIIPISFAGDNQTVLNVELNDTDAISVHNDDEVLTGSNDYYFNASAENDGDGSYSNPFKYLTADRIKANANIYLADGEYQLDVPKSIEKVNIYGTNPDNTVIRYDGVGFTVNTFLTVRNVTFSDFTITNYGNLTLTNTVLSYGWGYPEVNYANSFGGAIYTYENCPNAHVTIDNCTFRDNYAQYGGAIYMASGFLDVSNSVFVNNSAYNFGGAIACENTENILISKSKFLNSISIDDAGGAIYVRKSKMTLKNTDISNSSATFGAAITSLNCDISLNNLNCENNSAKWNGGAIYHMYGNFSLLYSNFNYNSANNGGALFIDSSASIKLKNNNFRYNSASGCAGAIYSFLNTVTEPLAKYNYFLENHASFYKDVYETSSINSTIGSGNYTMYKVNFTEIDELPSYYSLLDENQITSPKYQANSGNCWAFTAMSVLESCILKASNNYLDLSEENMKNLMALYSDYGWNIDTNIGGYCLMPWGYLASWLGPVNDSDDLFDDYSTLSPILNAVLHVQNILFLSRTNYTDNDAIKEALIKYGAVGTSMAYYSNYFDEETNAYYCFADLTDNHAVTIVGWDDNYSRDNFKWGSTIEGDGAWIVKNSWGAYWGDKGYFYVSYYDKTLALTTGLDFPYVILFNDTVRYDKNYQYDISGITEFLNNGSSEVWYKNIFTATDDEYLVAVSTYFDKVTNWTVSIYVNGEFILSKSGISNPGYYTFDLNRMIPLNVGDTFEVVFNLSVDGGASVPVSECHDLARDIYSFEISYISYDGKTWQDLYDFYWSNSNYIYSSQIASIKAFTVLNPINTCLYLNIGETVLDSTNISVKVVDEYGNLLKYGNVTFFVDGKNYTVGVVNGLAQITHISNQSLESVLAVFSAMGYNSSYAEYYHHSKTKVAFDYNITRHANNLIIDVLAHGIDEDVIVHVNGENHTVFNGNSLMLNNLSNGEYVINMTLSSDSIYEIDDVSVNVTINFKASAIIASNVVCNDVDGFECNVTLIDCDNNAVSNRTLRYRINGTWHNQTTDINGQILIPIKLDGGDYFLEVAFDGDDDYAESDASSEIKVKSKVFIDLAIDKYANNASVIVSLSKMINDTLTVIINNKAQYPRLTDGKVSLNLTNLENGIYNIAVSMDENIYEFNDVQSQFIVDVFETQIISNDIVNVEGEQSLLNITLMDIGGNPISNASITFVLDGHTYDATTDESGNVVRSLNLEYGEYDVDIFFNGSDKYFKSETSIRISVKNNITLTWQCVIYRNNAYLTLVSSERINDTFVVRINGDVAYVRVDGYYSYMDLINLPNGIYDIDISLANMDGCYEYNRISDSFRIDANRTRIISTDFVTYYGSNAVYTITLADVNANPCKNQAVEFELNNKTYSDITDSHGQASVNVNLTNGEYLIKIRYYGGDNYYESNASNMITVKTSIIAGGILVKTYNSYYAVKFTDGDGNPLNDTLVSFVLNNKRYDLITNREGIAKLKITNAPGNYNLKITNPNNGESLTRTIKVVSRISNNKNMITYEYGNDYYKVLVLNDDGSPAAGVTVKMTINGRNYNVKTNNKGYASMKISLIAKQYVITTAYKGFKVSNRITVKPVLTAKNVIKKKAKFYRFQAKLVNNKGKAFNGKKLTFLVKGKRYFAFTNKYGIATITIKLNLKVGNYRITTIYGKSRINNYLRIKG